MKEEQQLKVVDHQQIIDSSDYENDEDGQYEEVGDEDYDEDEEEENYDDVMIVPAAVAAPAQISGSGAGNG